MTRWQRFRLAVIRGEIMLALALMAGAKTWADVAHDRHERASRKFAGDN